MNYKTLVAIAVGSVISASAMANLEVNMTKEPSTAQVKLAPLPSDKMSEEGITVADDQLLNHVQDLIKSSYSKYFIKVHVMSGVVTLDGAIGSAADKSALIEKVKAIKGVKDVQDNLIISAPAKAE